MTTIALKTRYPRRPGTLSRAFARTGEIVALWHARARQRARLGELPPALLDDVGLSAEAARAEAAKPFWVE